MKKATVIKSNEILKDLNNDKQYRILCINSKEVITVVEINTKKLNIMYMSLNDINQNLYNDYELYEDDNSKYVDIKKLNQTEAEYYIRKKAFVDKVMSVYGPSYIGLIGKTKKQDFIDAYKSQNIPKTTAWRIITKFLQNGLNYYSLLNDKSSRKNSNYIKKPGKVGIKHNGIPLTDEVIRQFDEMLAEYKKNRNMSYALLYDKLCRLYYYELKDGEFRILPNGQRPTYYQLYHYCTNKLTQDEKEIIKTSTQEFRNNKRLLTGSPLTTISGPGELLEMDAQEMDVAIVSEYDRSKVIGRPILYALIDVYTRAIVAISVSFENNSLLGMTNCLLNLAEDKEQYCNQFGIENINKNLWPSNFLPKIIRMDRGSDFKSEKAEQILNELNIQRELVPGASGSYKGYIEQLWHQLNSAQNAALYNNGLIEKRYDSTHYKKAILTLKEITQIVISQVLVYNGLQLKNYPLTKDMVKKKIQPIPSELWEYGVEKNGQPRPIMNLQNFAYTLMSTPKASISKKGVCIDGLYYISTDMEFINLMYQTGTKKRKFECRYDERNISKAYYLNDKNELRELYLNVDIPTQKDFLNCTKSERLDFLETKNSIYAAGEQRNQTLRSSREAVIEATVQNAKNCDTSTEKTKKNMKENRKNEKMLQRKNNNIESRLNISNENPLLMEANNEEIKEDTENLIVEENSIGKKEEKEFDPIMATMQSFLLFEEEEDKKYGITYEDD